MTVPFKVKAIYEYKSDEPDDLIFENGQIITVIEDDDPDWYTGEYTSSGGQRKEGIFPRNFVEKYEPAIPTRPTRAPRKPAQQEAIEPQSPVPISTAVAASAPEQTPTTAILPPPAAREPVKEASIDPPKEVADPTPVVRAEPQAPPPAEQPKPAAKKPPPIVEKPSSFKDRIAAFNKPAAAPITPFKPPTASTGSTFIKKPFVAPPPSRNAYVPAPRDLPPQKVYQREEESEIERAEPEPQIRAPPVVLEDAELDEDQPKPTSLKDRIALLQKQQLEQAQRLADPTRKKEKPKRPPKTRTESSEILTEPSEDVTQAEHPTSHNIRDDTVSELIAPPRVSTDDSAIVHSPPVPARELVSDTNDADDSGGADTEDAQDTEEERGAVRSLKSPTLAARPEVHAEEREEEGTDTEEEEDPEVRRKRELRERMAKMSGGMGMMGMFGPTPVAAAPRRTKTIKEERAPEQHEQEEITKAPPVPIMALPGMSNLKQMPKPVPESEEDNDTALPTPMTAQDADDDYISQKLSRRSTERSLAPSIHERPPPPPPPTNRPEPPQSPGARPAPPPPPTRTAGDLPTMQAEQEFDTADVAAASSPPSSRPLSIAGPAGPRSMPPPLPIRGMSKDIDVPPSGAPPVPMSPTSPIARPPPPPPPGQSLTRRATNDSNLHPPTKHDSEEEVTEYDGDYDTDIATGEKHKAALRSHNRDSSMDEGTFSDDAHMASASPQMRSVPPIPPIPSAAPMDTPPPPPPVASPKTRESVDVPRSAPPPLPTQPPRGLPQPRESVDTPRVAPPPIPSPQTSYTDGEYDPYRSSIHQGLPGMAAMLRRQTDEIEEHEEPQSWQSGYTTMSPVERSMPPPPPPPVERAAPPPAPVSNAPMYGEPDMYSMSGALSANRGTAELGRSNTLNRRSADVTRPTNEQGFIASDVDVAPNSMWWTRENNPPPALQNRNDVLWEVESSTTQKRGGKSSVSRDVYVLYQDYSQTTINATFDASEPTHVSFEQSHERPPMQPRKDQLESASETFGAQIAKAAEKASGSSVGEGTAHELVAALIRSLHSALMPVGTRAYGALVYANLANASTQQFDEIRPGDIITFRNAKFAGHKGSLHQKYSQDVSSHVGVVIDWDGTKKKIRVWEQGNQERGKKAKVRDESYRVADLKSGEVRVWRVMPRSYVNWGTS